MSKKDQSPEDPGIRAARRLVNEYDFEPEHAIQVTKIVLQLFDDTGELHHLGDPEKRLLEAAALLHDIGYSNRPDQHHKGARDLILSSKPEGFSGRERKMVACIARYHRKGHPKPSHKVYCDLNEADRIIVDRLAALLRIADGLDRSHLAATKNVRVGRSESSVSFLVEQRHPNPTDIWGALRKRQLFEETFGVELDIEVG